MTHDKLKRAALQRRDVRTEYNALSPEFEILRQMLKARRDAGLTQAEVAERMGTKPPAVTRLESSLGSGGHSPSLSTLQKYAQAVGCRLEVRLVRSRTGSK
jgi:transcriptional regulator with XRE-family HTH domain